ncbi:ABC transporter ATP-binding protein [Aquibium sp. A9E412]|uniref:ABC transporter ATP-binding protein n=1 Tax=Aquibium sp. A9E412 TaxID=2976767 RepID=UPI0025AEDE51|nr:ABC transporter ATP-binding protein [Aquibium sp. A9E412]MDN2567302.1 ABC transporter ATP-binding protein [Aquibium sp. A9E412]
MSLDIRNVSKAYGGFVAVDDASLSVPSTGMVGLIGPNGAGKSTLFSVISGLLRPDSGTVAFGDQPLEGRGPVARARLGLGRTFQVPREFASLTVRENLLAALTEQKGERLFDVVARFRSVAEVERSNRDRVAGALEEFGLAAVADNLASNLSGGQKKLLELARIWMTGPRMLLLDEPFSGVNPVLIDTISQQILRLNASGIGCLIVEHNIPALANIVDVFCAMDRGRTIVSGSPDTVLAHPMVREAYLGRSQ